MPEPSSRLACMHRVTEHDVIDEVNEAWKAFARDNGAADLVERVLGTVLWEHILGDEVRTLYRTLLEGVRAKGHDVIFPFRCDSPEIKRFLDMTIHPLPDGSVEFHCVLLHEERRDYMAVVDQAVTRSDDFLIMCAWCKWVKAPHWRELEEVIPLLGVFERRIPPKLSHGICDACRAGVLEDLHRLS